MKLLIVDFLFVDAHKDMNINFISAVSRIATTDVLSLNGYYDNTKKSFQNSNVNIIDITLKRKSGTFGARSFSLRLMKKAAVFTQKNKYDAILCLGFETTLFGLGLYSFKSIPFLVFHHKNIDELTNKMKRVAFSVYKNKVYHIVFEEFFRDRLIKGIGVCTDRVFVIPHPVKPIENVITEKKYDCIGLCNSNDERFIQETVDRNDDFQKHGFHILLRSKTLEKRGGAVEVIKGFMDKENYDELMAAGKAVFVPLPDTYIYRLSGSIYDALSRGKLVYTTSKFYAQNYERRYPGICRYVGNVNQLIERLHEQRNDKASSSFEMFIEGHSIKTVSHDIEEMLKVVLKGVKS